MLEIKHCYSGESDFRGHYIHAIKVKKALENVRNQDQNTIISLVFSEYGLSVESMRNLESDLIVTNETSDETPDQTINKTFYLLKRLNELLKLGLDCDGCNKIEEAKS